MGYGLPVARRGPERRDGNDSGWGILPFQTANRWSLGNDGKDVNRTLHDVFFFANAMAARCVLRCGKSPHSWVKGVVKRRIFLGDFSWGNI